MKNKFIINAGFVLTLLILVAIMFMSHWKMTQLVRYDQKQDLTFNIIQSLDRLLIDIVDARTDQRVFSRTGSGKYLESYREAYKNVELELETLKRLAGSQPWLQERLTAIKPLVKVKMAQIEEKIEDDSAEGNSIASHGEFAENGRVPVAEIRMRVTAAQNEAIRILRELSAGQEADFRKMEQLLVTISVIIFVLVCTVFVLLKRDLASRLRIEQELTGHRDQLDLLVKVRTVELLHANQQLRVEIEERKRFEGELEQKERKYRSLFENSLDAVLLTTSGGKIVSANRAASDLFGMSEDALIRGGCAGIVYPGDNRLDVALQDQFLCGKIMGERDFLRKDGTGFPAEVSSVVLADGASSFVIIHDITERKWAEQIRRNLTEHQETIQEQERLAISREVHDEIGQYLTALKLDLSWIDHRFPPDNSELAGRLEEMSTSLDHLIVKARHIAAELRPPLLDNLGLAAAIEWQSGEFRRRSGIECHLMLNEGIEVYDEHAATTIMRIFQEALTNIIRHSQATEISISLCEREDQILLEIFDNGRGITIQETGSPTAYGIMGMRERARLCQGELTIIGTPGEGTAVCLIIPRHSEKEKS